MSQQISQKLNYRIINQLLVAAAAILLSTSLTACSDQGSSNGSENSTSNNSGDNPVKIIDSTNGETTVPKDPQDETVPTIDAETPGNSSANCDSSSSGDGTVICEDSN
jgi:hypothetical protein